MLFLFCKESNDIKHSFADKTFKFDKDISNAAS
jgi:hypothetical protein